ncbi:MAG: PilZ domain-containing protein [Terriglobales bacterium]
MATDAVVVSGFTNTRRWPRYKLDVPIRAIVHNGSNTKLVDGRGTELNEGGMAIFAGLELKVGDAVEIEFTPPYTGQPIRVRSIVRNRRGYIYGVEFFTVSQEDTQKVRLIHQMLQAMGSPAQ